MSMSIADHIRQAAQAFKPGVSPDPRITLSEEPRNLALTDAQIIARLNAPVYARPEPQPQQWSVPGLLPVGKVAMLYGLGGSKKSLFALALAAHIALNEPVFCGISLGVGGPVLYIDAEMDQSDFDRRAYRIARSLGISEPPGTLHYERIRKGTMRHAETAQNIARLVAEMRPALVVVDSWFLATGIGSDRTEETLDVFDQMQEWGVAVLVIDHEPKVGGSLYGSVYKFNCARSVIRASAPTKRALVLQQLKNNLDEGEDELADDDPTFFIRVDAAKATKTYGTITTFSAVDPADPIFKKKGERDAPLQLTAADKLYLVLARHADGATVAQLVAETGSTDDAIRKLLTALRKAGRATTSKGVWRIAGCGRE